MTSKFDLTDRLLADVASLYLSDLYSDVEFVVEDQLLPAHRVVLAVRSEYFRAMLYGGMSESTQRQIHLDVPLDLFKLLLQHIYTGNLPLATLKDNVLCDMQGIANQYGFQDLELAISTYLIQNLTLKNACVILDAARLNHLKDLTQACLLFTDRHAPELLQHESLNLLSKQSLEMILQRDTFCAPEGEIFHGVLKWSRYNQTIDTESVWDFVRMSLIGIKDLVQVVRPLKILDSDRILDVIAQKFSNKLPYRAHLLLEENVATAKYSSRCIKGNNDSLLLDGNLTTFHGIKCYTWHTISERNDSGIVVELGDMYNINHIRLLLWDKGDLTLSYFIEISADQCNWERVIDHSEYHCRAWQHLYFTARPVRYIRLVGTHCSYNHEFAVVSLEATHTTDVPKIVGQIVAPVDNVATISKQAYVIKDNPMVCNTLIDGNYVDYNSTSGYTSLKLGSLGILIRLRQPYHVGSMRLLLLDCNDWHYSFFIETSTNNKDWHMVVDKRDEDARSWQTFHFTPRPVVYIRIVGTGSNDDKFSCVHFECPSQA